MPIDPAKRTPAPRPSAEPMEQLGFEGMPERLFVATPSKLASFEDCPRRYRYAYVDRPTPPKDVHWAHNSLGASVHTALRNWYGLPAKRRRPEEMARLLRVTWVSEGYRDEAQERAVFTIALGWLERYAQELDPLVEPVGFERTVGAKTAILALSGRADRIDRRGDELVIVDYKTGRFGVTQDDARGSAALALYAFAASQVFRRSCHRVELHHLPTGKVAAHEHTDATLARAVERAEATARDIQAGERALDDGAEPDTAFPTRPGTLCSYCDFRKICPDGQAAPVKEPWAAVAPLVEPEPAQNV